MAYLRQAAMSIMVCLLITAGSSARAENLSSGKLIVPEHFAPEFQEVELVKRNASGHIISHKEGDCHQFATYETAQVVAQLLGGKIIEHRFKGDTQPTVPQYDVELGEGYKPVNAGYAAYLMRLVSKGSYNLKTQLYDKKSVQDIVVELRNLADIDSPVTYTSLVPVSKHTEVEEEHEENGEVLFDKNSESVGMVTPVKKKAPPRPHDESQPHKD